MVFFAVVQLACISNIFLRQHVATKAFQFVHLPLLYMYTVQCSCTDRVEMNSSNAICFGPSVPPCTEVDGSFQVSTVGRVTIGNEMFSLRLKRI